MNQINFGFIGSLFFFVMVCSCSILYSQEVIKVSIHDSCIITNVKITKADLALLRGICPPTLKKVTTYTIRIVGNGFVESLIVKGNKWDNKVNTKISKLTAGNKLIVDKIIGINHKGIKENFGAIITVDIIKN